jgi:hypothetical protein
MRPSKRAVDRVGLLIALLLFATAPLACSDCTTEIVTNSLPDGSVGILYSLALDSNCGGDFWFVSSGNLPPGIGLLDNGILRGVPTEAGKSTFTLGLIDTDDGDSAYKGFTMTIRPAS